MKDQWEISLTRDEADAYLERIHMVRDTPSVDYLDHLIESHQLHVPFENLEQFEGSHLAPLDKDTLFGKIVTRHRGGFCFELNGLFCALLASLGFSAVSSLARVLHGDAGPDEQLFRDRCETDGGDIPQIAEHAMISHRCILADVEGDLRYVDVGFGGPSPSLSLQVIDGAGRIGLGQRFTMERFGPHWWTVVYHGSQGSQATLQFTTIPQDPCVFVPLAYYFANNPASYFRSQRVLNKRIDGGNVQITGDVFLRRVDGIETTEQIVTDGQLDKLLETEFGIVDWR